MKIFNKNSSLIERNKKKKKNITIYFLQKYYIKMKIKTILNKLNYSIIEEKIQQEIYHKIDSTINTKIKKASVPEDDIMQIMHQTNKKEIQTIKITKALSSYSKQIKKNYTSKIIGPMELTFYNNVELLGKNLNKKNTKTNSI